MRFLKFEICASQIRNERVALEFSHCLGISETVTPQFTIWLLSASADDQIPT